MKGLLAAAIRDEDPVLVFEHKGLYPSKGEVPDGDHVVPLGGAAVVREGADVTLVGLAFTVGACLEAADEARRGRRRGRGPRPAHAGAARRRGRARVRREDRPAGDRRRRGPASSAGAPRSRRSSPRRRSTTSRAGDAGVRRRGAVAGRGRARGRGQPVGARGSWRRSRRWPSSRDTTTGGDQCRSAGDEVLLPTSAVGAFPRPHWLQGRVLGTLNEPVYRSHELRVDLRGRDARSAPASRRRRGWTSSSTAPVLRVGGARASSSSRSSTTSPRTSAASSRTARPGDGVKYRPFYKPRVTGKIHWERPIFESVVYAMQRATDRPFKVSLARPRAAEHHRHDEHYGGDQVALATRPRRGAQQGAASTWSGHGPGGGAADRRAAALHPGHVADRGAEPHVRGRHHDQVLARLLRQRRRPDATSARTRRPT